MWFLVSFLLLNEYVLSDIGFPVTPCPNVFNYQYKNDLKSEVFGVMVFRNDLSGRYKVELNMTVAAFVNQNIIIKRITTPSQIQNGENLTYHVMLPLAKVVPEVVSIVFNEKLWCSAFLKQDHNYGYTTLHAFDFFATHIPTRFTSTNTILEGSILNTSLQPPLQIITKPGTQTKQTSITDYWVSVIITDATSTPIKNIPTQTTTKPIITETTIPPLLASLTPLSGKPPSFDVLVNRLKEEIECGIVDDTQPLLVHAKPTPEGQFPWLTAMFHLNEETAEYRFKCGGSLVSPKHVITAAHCVRVEKNSVISKDNIILVLGKHNIHSWAVRSEIRDVKEIYVHPEYIRPSDADIAVVVMFKTVDYTSKIKPICLWPEENVTDSIVGSKGVVVGWGKDESDAMFVPEPRQLTMPVVSQEDCLRSDERFLKLTSHQTFCAGSKNGEGPCTGDSGGGFIMKRNGKWTLRGIVSSALVDPKTYSCDVNNYMVFVDVAKYILWIKHILAKSNIV